MALDKLVDSTQLDADLTSIANAIRTKGGTSEQLSFPSGMAQAIADLPSGGTTITDGIVVKARNANGYATEIDFYGNVIEEYQFGQGSNNTVGFMYLEKVNFKTEVREIKNDAFQFCRAQGFPAPIPQNVVSVGARAYSNTRYKSFDFPLSLTGRLADLIVNGNTYAESFKAPGITSLATSGGIGNGQFYGCTGLKTVEIGSVAHGITESVTWTFRNCTQTDLTITLYCTGSYADTLLSNVRSGATNATIIIKASENTTYGGNSYLAGETILTSTPT